MAAATVATLAFFGERDGGEHEESGLGIEVARLAGRDGGIVRQLDALFGRRHDSKVRATTVPPCSRSTGSFRPAAMRATSCPTPTTRTGAHRITAISRRWRPRATRLATTA